MNNIMFDLETLGLNDDAAILSIGAVKFDHNYITDEFYVKISLESSLLANLSVDASTIKFWLSQPSAARNEAFSGTEPLHMALLSLIHWADFDNIDEVWTNGNKDIIWLKSAMSATGVNPKEPWLFWKERDFRTAKSLLPNVTITDEPVAHHALHDARWQARYLIKALNQ